MVDLSRWAPSLTAFIEWLAPQSDKATQAWSDRLRSKRSETVEAAVAEAVVWDYLECRCDSSRLAERLGTGGVDFEFTAGGRPFFVEVTNIAIDAATQGSHLPEFDLQCRSYGLLTSRIRTKVRGKLLQARRQLDAPLLVAVTTLHWNAGRACMDRRAVEFAMGSPPRITGDLNPMTGAIEGEFYQSTDLSQAVFLTPRPLVLPDGSPVAQAKFQPISGFLLGGFGAVPRDVHVVGGLNPEAARPFDPALLPDIPLCTFEEWPISKRLGFRWTIPEEGQRDESLRRAEHRLRASGLGKWLDDVQHKAAL